MASIKRFEDMEAWKLSRKLCLLLGKLIDNGVFKTNYRLINQIEGSSGSIMDNISEGFERGTRAEFIQFLGFSKVHVANSGLNYTVHWTEIILRSHNLMNFISQQ